MAARAGSRKTGNFQTRESQAALTFVTKSGASPGNGSLLLFIEPRCWTKWPSLVVWWVVGIGCDAFFHLRSQHNFTHFSVYFIVRLLIISKCQRMTILLDFFFDVSCYWCAECGMHFGFGWNREWMPVHRFRTSSSPAVCVRSSVWLVRLFVGGVLGGSVLSICHAVAQRTRFICLPSTLEPDCTRPFVLFHATPQMRRCVNCNFVCSPGGFVVVVPRRSVFMMALFARVV